MQNSLLPAPQNPGASLPPAGADLARLRSSLDSMVAAGAPNAAPGPVEERQLGGPLHQGRVSRGGPQVADLIKMPLLKTAWRRPT